MISLPISFRSFSQKKITSLQQVWVGYNGQLRFTSTWGMWADGQIRTKEEFFTNYSQAMGSIGLTYYVNDNTKLTAAYTYAHHFPGDGHKNISQPESRPWQQVQWYKRLPRLRLMQWVRLEERFRRKIKNDNEWGEGNNFNWRLRYNCLASFALSKKSFAANTLSIAVGNEILLNAGKEIVYNYFDQNRFFAGFAYYLNSHDNIQFGYLNVFQQLASGNKYKATHVARVTYFQNLDFRKISKH